MKTESHIPLPLKSFIDINSSKFSLHRDLSENLTEEFLSSVERFGLFQPPVVVKNDEGYQLICGKRRVQALRKIDINSNVLCRALDISDPADLLAIILEDQRLSGPISVIMAARFFKLIEFLVPQKSRAKIIKQLNIGSHGQLQRLLPLLNLEQSIRDAIHNEDISDKIGLTLCTISPEDRLFLCNLFVALSLNKNKQKRVLDMGLIVAAQQGTTLKSVFHENFSSFLPENIGSNIPQTVGNLLKCLHEASHPLSSSAEKMFNDRKNDLGLPSRCILSHSPAFERDSVSLSIEFRNLEEMAKVWQRIKDHLQ